LLLLIYYAYIITGGEDYESGPFDVMIAPGITSVSLNISIFDNNIFEANETFNLTINQSTLPDRVYLQPGCMLTVTIVDDDGESSHVCMYFQCETLM